MAKTMREFAGDRRDGHSTAANVPVGAVYRSDEDEGIVLDESPARARRPFVRDVSVEFVGGDDTHRVLMRATLGNIEPQDVPAWILERDPKAKFRDDFPSKGFQRETKLASVFSVQGSCFNGNLAFELLARGPDGGVKIRVNRDAGEFAAKLRALGKVPEAEMDALDKALEAKKTYTIGPLDKADWFGAKYSAKGDDPGSGFLESIQAEGMVETAKNA